MAMRTLAQGPEFDYLTLERVTLIVSEAAEKWRT